MAGPVMPLGSYGVLRTTDVDDARASIAASLAPHRLTPLAGAGGFRALHNAATLGRLSIHYIDYGAEVEVAVDGMDFQLVQIPLAGLTTISCGRERVVATQRTAAVTAAGESVRMRYSAGNPRLMVRVGAALLQDRLALAERVGAVPEAGIAATFDLTRGRGRSWRGMLDVLLADLERESGLSSVPLAAEALEVALVDGLIASLVPGPEAEAGPVPTPHERVVKRAAQLIEDHCAEPLGTADVAEAVGLSVRLLRAGFQEHFATTPMAYLRQARLRRVRDDLSDGTATSVTDAALRWGVTHLGRLSGDYRAAFGETPSETLQRAR
ncbi:AraC family transcriptional regulator [Pimelobacter sp. 30-1]|uniref:AraC family transcriptional regulator n=1 Tax=Pimelobacter sp. 30-1 TaxID=2004991 RepID=UPI001C044EB2|nr:AraC family transcriptional regulator [Pimelobacter sp. 30-1]MBU2694417.1 hypothetical protein [Pimelobacter sp. 30-1]